MKVRHLIATVLVATLGLAACGGAYYLVNDPHTGREYYTRSLERSRGGVSFRDEKSRAIVTLQNSEIMEISHDQYRAHTGAR
jgi:hypothetical protein